VAVTSVLAEIGEFGDRIGASCRTSRLTMPEMVGDGL
jgi:hypothetical protein